MRIVLALLLLTGCAGEWRKPGGDLEADRKACLLEFQRAPAKAAGVFANCMRASGWSWTVTPSE